MGAVRLLLLCGRRGNTRLQRLTIKVPQLHAAIRAARGESHSVAPHIDGEYSIAMSLHDRGRWWASCLPLRMGRYFNLVTSKDRDAIARENVPKSNGTICRS